MKVKMIFILAGLLYVFAGCSSDADDSMDEEMAMMEDDTPMVMPRTEIPDPAFEAALIELSLDNELDGTVLTANIAEVTEIILNDKGISDLTGLEDFVMLEGLWADDNLLTSLDMSGFSNLLFLFASNNQLSSLNVGGLGLLEKIDVKNNTLSQIDISSNTSLQLLVLKDNDLESIDVSFITDPLQLNQFDVEGNPLDCIKVNSAQLGDIPSQWKADPEDNYALNCD